MSIYDILYDKELDDNDKLVDEIGWAQVGSDEYRLLVFRLLKNLVRDVENLKEDIESIKEKLGTQSK